MENVMTPEQRAEHFCRELLKVGPGIPLYDHLVRYLKAAENDGLERAAVACDRGAYILNGTADSNAGDAEYRSEARACTRQATSIRALQHPDHG